MKATKRIFALTLILLLVLSLGTSAFAATNGTITVTGASAGETYKLYKIFDVTYVGASTAPTGYNYSYTTDKTDPTQDTVLQTLLSAASPFDVTQVNGGSTYNVAKKTGKTDDDILSWLEGTLIPLKTAADKSITVPNGANDPKTADIKFENLTDGYYFINSTMGSFVMVDTNTPNVTIADKNVYPDVDKIITAGTTVNADGDYSTASIGDTVSYKLTVKDGKGTDEQIVVHDKMEAGLTLDTTTIVVKYFYKDDQGTVKTDTITNDTAKCSIDTTTAFADSCDFEVTLKPDFVKTLTDPDTDGYPKVEITFDATLNADAEISTDTNDNTTYLKYGNTGEYIFTSTETTVETETFYFDIVKTDADNVFLTGAEFELYSDAAGTTKIDVVKVSDSPKVYRPALTGETGVKIAVDAGGLAQVKGLNLGTYYLKEVTVPSGYNGLSSLQKVELTTANIKYDPTKGQDAAKYEQAEGGVHITNKTGTELPSTGGMGTTVFYALGSVFALAAACLLLIKRKNTAF